MARPEDSRKRHDLQWLRALAALEVVLWHSDLVTKGFSSWRIAEAPYAPFGGIGVELFFVISGFIMVRTAPRYQSAFAFLRARALRIYPLYWIFTSLAFAAYLINPAWQQGAGANDPAVVILSYLNFPQRHYPVLGPGWTLEHEAVFYTLIALTLLVLHGIGRATKLAFGAAVFALGVLGVLIGVGGGPIPLVWTFDLASPYLLAFALGWFLGLAERQEGRPRVAYYLCMFGALGVIAMVPAGVLVHMLLLRIAVAALVVILACEGRALLEADVLPNRLMWQIGDASYSLYLSHIFILSIGGKLLTRFAPPSTWDTPLRLLGIVASILFGLVCYAVLERPLLRRLNPRPAGQQSPPNVVGSSVPASVAARLPAQRAGLGLLLALTIFPAKASGVDAGAACPAEAISVRAGTSLQTAVAAAAPGARFCLRAGEHRLATAAPKDGQTFHGEVGAVLNGARRLTVFRREGPYWVAQGMSHRNGWRPEAVCLPGRERCARPETLFIDDVALWHAGRLQDVVKGSFFFEDGSGRIYLLDDPTGRKVEASALPYAFRGGARDVLIENLVIEKYAPPVQHAAVGSDKPSPGWVVRANEIRLNYALGLNVGAGSQVLGNSIHDNGQMGAGCTGRNVLFEQNEIASNGMFSGVDPNWEGGGAKCAVTENLVVRRNYLHHNNGYGFWTDIDNIGSLYEQNLVEYNAAGGITHEISYAAVIRNNIFRGNGPVSPIWLWGAAILIQNSRDVEVFGNSVDMTGRGNGISLVQQGRGSGKYGPYVTVNNRVHNNTLVSATPDHGASGAIADHDPDGMRAGGNRFDRNLYRVADPLADQWAWVDRFRDWAEHRRLTGQEANGEMQVIAPSPVGKVGGG